MLRPSLQREIFYDNVLMVAHDGHHLAMISDDRAEWYLARTLAVDVPAPDGWTRAIQLLFTPKGRPAEVAASWIAPRETRCVVCGGSHELTVHHVVPRFLRKTFPRIYSERQDQWCVLLCQKHHNEAELLIVPFISGSDEYKQAAQMATSDPVVVARRKLFTLTQNGCLEKILSHAPERMQELLRRAQLDEIPKNEADWSAVLAPCELANGEQKERVAMAAREIVAKFGGPDGTQKFFKDLFMQLEPRFPFPGMLEERKNVVMDSEPYE